MFRLLQNGCWAKTASERSKNVNPAVDSSPSIVVTMGLLFSYFFSLFLNLHVPCPLAYHVFHGASNLSSSFYLSDWRTSFVELFPSFLPTFFCHSLSYIHQWPSLLLPPTTCFFSSPPVQCIWVCSCSTPTLYIWPAVTHRFETSLIIL